MLTCLLWVFLTLVTLPKKPKDMFVMEEAEHDWLKKILQDEKIGPEVFGFNIRKVLDALDDFERTVQGKEN